LHLSQPVSTAVKLPSQIFAAGSLLVQLSLEFLFQTPGLHSFSADLCYLPFELSRSGQQPPRRSDKQQYGACQNGFQRYTPSQTEASQEGRPFAPPASEGLRNLFW